MGDRDVLNGFQERGARIRERREALSMSQTNLAEMVGTTQQTIDRIEKGAIKNPKLLPEIDRALFIENNNRLAAYSNEQSERNMRIKYENSLCDLSILSNIKDSRKMNVILKGLFLKGFPIENDPNGYAVGIGGSIYEQDYASGDIMLISPMLPIMPGSRVLFWHGEEGERAARIARFVEEVADGWVSSHGVSDDHFLMQREDWRPPHAVAAQLFGFHSR